MLKLYRDELDALDAPWAYADGSRAGKRSLTQGLAPRALVFRVDSAEAARELGAAFGPRDGNGVAAGADAAVARATTSRGAPLRDDLRARFEASLGADLSGVRVHTDAASAEASAAVGAKAYTVGTDIHFGADHYRPDDPFGMHLLAHEVAHTVQQAGAAPHRQHQLEVSTPGDAAEVEADRAADAMVAGAPASVGGASVGLHRQPADNSYNRGDLRWGQGGTALQEDEAKDWAAKKVALVTKAAGLLGTAVGFQGVGSEALMKKLEKQADDQFKANVKWRKLELGCLDDQIDYLEDDFNGWWEPKRNAKQDAELGSLKDRERTAKARLKKLEDARSSSKARSTQEATAIATSIIGYGGKGLSAAAVINGLIGKLDPSLFASASEATGKLGKIAGLIDLVSKGVDRTALKSFQNNPNLDTAAAWGGAVADIFDGVSGLAEGLPAGWDDVVKGVLQMPKIVVNQFLAVVKARYKRLDDEVRDGNGAKSLEEGTEG